MRHFLLLSLFISSCSFSDVTNKRIVSSALEENEIDPKFETYEGGSHRSEKEVHQKIIDFSIQMLEKNRHKHKYIPRDAHAKSHGCFKAEFIVNNKQLPAEHRLGLFKENKSYNAYIRYSNNDHLPKRKDKGLDLRGMAIKVMNVPGRKVMRDYEHEHTQDFLMYGSKKFFIKDNKDYVSFIRGLRDDNAVKTLITEQPKAGVMTAMAQFKIRNKINPLGLSYFSAIPIRLGARDNEDRTAIKYGVYPCKGFRNKELNKYDQSEHDYMRKNLNYMLKKNKKACFDFKVQRQMNPRYMPIEDSTVAWPETGGRRARGKKAFSPYVTVAKVLLSYPENIDNGTEENIKFCEDLSFSPWHAIPEHKPLGRTMRMRRDVYRAISDFRRKENGANFHEPN